MQQNRMYYEFAHLWTLISDPADYADEAKYWRDVLRAKLGPGWHEILELGVGGGNNLSHLTNDFKATAVDISSQMLSNSIRLNPDVEHHVGDMRMVRLGRKFKAVLIHDAISYLLTEDELRATFATARAHLEPGGVFITAPDLFRETFDGTHVSHQIRRDANPEFTFIEYIHDPDPNDTTLESIFFYMIKQDGKLRVEEDQHITGIFPIDTWLKLLDETGFEPEKWPYPVHEDGREAYLIGGVLR